MYLSMASTVSYQNFMYSLQAVAAPRALWVLSKLWMHGSLLISTWTDFTLSRLCIILTPATAVLNGSFLIHKCHSFIAGFLHMDGLGLKAFLTINVKSPTRHCDLALS